MVVVYYPTFRWLFVEISPKYRLGKLSKLLTSGFENQKCRLTEIRFESSSWYVAERKVGFLVMKCKAQKIDILYKKYLTYDQHHKLLRRSLGNTLPVKLEN